MLQADSIMIGKGGADTCSVRSLSSLPANITDSLTDEATLPVFMTSAHTTQDTFPTSLFDLEGFFSQHPFLLHETGIGIPGIPGDPIPYNMKTDIMVTSILLLCFFCLMLVLSRSLHVFTLQTKNLFSNRSRNETTMLNRDNELNIQAYVNIINSLLLGILLFHYSRILYPDIYGLASPYSVLLTEIAAFLGYYTVKNILYKWVNWTFFSQQSQHQWNNTYNLLCLLKVLALFPLTLASIYLELPFNLFCWLISIIFLLFVSLVAYKSKHIFFNYSFCHIHHFLYFCTLEIAILVFSLIITVF